MEDDRSRGAPRSGAAARPGPRFSPPATIVPLQGLPIVGAVAIFLVVAIAGNWLWALGFSHVVGGALWTGVDLIVGFVVGPIMGR